jgi:lysophospholipase L1-like esterase
MLNKFKFDYRVAVCGALFFFSNFLNEADAKMVLKTGDRICFFGDSITQFGLASSGYVTLVKRSLVEKHSNEKIEVMGAGIPGNKIADLESRIDKELAEIKPSIAFVFIGINDLWMGLHDPTQSTPIQKFKQSLETLIKIIEKSGAEVVLCTPTVIGEKTLGSNTLDPALDAISTLIRQEAKDNKLELVDLREVFTKYLTCNNRANKNEGILTIDGVHLNDSGNKLAADTIVSIFQ